MYGIYADGQLVGLSQKPRYVYKKPTSGAWVEVKDNGPEAEAIAVKGKLFNIFGKEEYVKDAPFAIVREIENGEILFDQIEKAERYQADLEYLAAMTDVELSQEEEV